MRRYLGRPIAALGITAFLTGACFQPEKFPAGSATSGGGMGGQGGGSASSAGGGGADTGGGGADAGGGGADAGPALVVRYYMDGATSGKSVSTIVDSGPNALPLTWSYQWPDLGSHYVEAADGHTGFRWSGFLSMTSASRPIVGTPIFMSLDGNTGATIEVVVDIVVSNIIDESSRILWIGRDNDLGAFSLTARPGVIAFNLNNEEAGSWAVSENSGPKVVHVVLDTGLAPENRVKLYVGGSLQGTNQAPPPSDVEISLNEGNEVLVLGNTQDGMRSFTGTLYYAAVYSGAFSEKEVQDNVAVLEADDDTPTP